MPDLVHIIVSKTFVLLLVVLGHVQTNAQEEQVTDNKGNIITIRNTVVTVGSSAPTGPVLGDLWLDTTDTDHQVTRVWDGTAWQEVTHQGTSGSLFFAGTDGNPRGNPSELFWDDVNLRLGIGTSTPNDKVEVNGAIRSQALLTADGTLTEPGYRFTNDPNTGMFRPATDEIAFAVGGLEAIRFEGNASSTNVRIPHTLELDGQLLDAADSAGTTGQVLTATATGTAWATQPIRAFGKIAANGTVTKATSGITVTKLAGNGHYRVNLPIGLVSDADYIIQLTQPGRAGAGNDDPGISYSNQTASGFEVIIGDNDNGRTNRARYNSEFMFTVLDL